MIDFFLKNAIFVLIGFRPVDVPFTMIVRAEGTQRLVQGGRNMTNEKPSKNTFKVRVVASVALMIIVATAREIPTINAAVIIFTIGGVAAIVWMKSREICFDDVWMCAADLFFGTWAAIMIIGHSTASPTGAAPWDHLDLGLLGMFSAAVFYTIWRV